MVRRCLKTLQYTCTTVTSVQQLSWSQVQDSLQLSAETLLLLPQSHPQTPPSNEEKRSGEPSQISWASGCFSDIVTQQRSKFFVENPLKKSKDTRMEINKFNVVRELLHNNQRSHNLIGLPPFWGINPRNLTSFTRPFLARRRTRGGHETTALHGRCCSLGLT